MAVVNIKQKPDVDEVPVEILAQSIEAIAAAMKKISATRLTRRALILLIAEDAKVNRGDVSRVLDSLEQLERTYLKPKPDTKKKLD